MKQNDIELNYTKTKFTIFEKRYMYHPNLVIGENEISSCVSYKYLGLHFDKKLSFQIHIEMLILKLSRHCGILYKLRETLTKSQLVQCIRSYISPVVQYGVLLYGLGLKTSLQKVLLMQKKLIRVALRLPSKASVLGKFKELKIGTVYELHVYELLKNIYVFGRSDKEWLPNSEYRNPQQAD